MIVQRVPDRVTSWSLAFFTGHKYRFARFVPGRFKHVLAFGWSEPCRTWVVFDVAFADTRIYVLPDGPWGREALAELLTGATIVCVNGDLYTRRYNVIRLGFYCVPAVVHLCGLRCGAVLTPTGLYRRLIKAGAVVVNGEQQPSALRPARAA